ncbi:hypothetical protein [Glycomyces tenuis]|uniref:hypothetical protein n=1 Tax=Glycomyces tenuis TaxID=58116 RepID=UPI0003F8D0E7|nr:hypothetical protein [Glycomyces tenuis]
MKTGAKPKQKKLLTLAGAVFAVFVLKALVDNNPGGSELSVDLSPTRGPIESLAETGAIWGVAIPTGLYLVYLALMKVAPAQMRQDHAERASKRIRKWVLVGAAAFTLLAYALHYVPVLFGQMTSGIGSAGGAVGANLTPVLVILALGAYLLVGYLWAVRAETKTGQLARGGVVYGPLLVIVLVLQWAGVIGP